MQLIDTHAHLTAEGILERIDEVLSNCRAQNVEHVIAVSSGRRDADAALNLARTRGMISCTVGVHPHEAAKVDESEIAGLTELITEPEVVAYGEIGLDYHYNFADKETQLRVFSMQLDRVRIYDLPLVIHCREAFDDTIELLEHYGFTNRPVVFHCFTGSSQDALRVAEHGWRLSFTGIVTFKRSTTLQDIARTYPANQIMIETDSPYLSPEPVRNMRTNEPANVVHTARFLAELRGVSLDELARQTTENARKFFQLPEPPQSGTR